MNTDNNFGGGAYGGHYPHPGMANGGLGGMQGTAGNGGYVQQMPMGHLDNSASMAPMVGPMGGPMVMGGRPGNSMGDYGSAGGVGMGELQAGWDRRSAYPPQDMYGFRNDGFVGQSMPGQMQPGMQGMQMGRGLPLNMMSGPGVTGVGMAMGTNGLMPQMGGAMSGSNGMGNKQGMGPPMSPMQQPQQQQQQQQQPSHGLAGTNNGSNGSIGSNNGSINNGSNAGAGPNMGMSVGGNNNGGSGVKSMSIPLPSMMGRGGNGGIGLQQAPQSQQQQQQQQQHQQQQPQQQQQHQHQQMQMQHQMQQGMGGQPGMGGYRMPMMSGQGGHLPPLAQMAPQGPNTPMVLTPRMSQQMGQQMGQPLTPRGGDMASHGLMGGIMGLPGHASGHDMYGSASKTPVTPREAPSSHSGQSGQAQSAQGQQSHGGQSGAPQLPAQGMLERGENPAVELVNSDLWRSFCQHTTEMIISRHGRCLFPALKIRVSGLVATDLYMILLDFVTVNDFRYKYDGQKWIEVGQADKPLPVAVFVHPESPNTGEHWMDREISFAKVKLTNKIDDAFGHIMLNTFQKYIPRFHVVRVNPPPQQPTEIKVESFQETEFIGVTAYQNEVMKEMKKNANPFARPRLAVNERGDDSDSSDGFDKRGGTRIDFETGRDEDRRSYKRRKVETRRDTSPSPPAFLADDGDYSTLPAPVNILVADDDAVTRMLMEGFLKSFGFLVTNVSNGKEAYDLLLRDDCPFHAALIDCHMPVMDGFDLLRNIVGANRPEHLKCALILMSAIGGNSYAEKAIDLGADDYLPKPVPRRLLKKRIDYYLARRFYRDNEDKMLATLDAKRAEVTQMAQSNKMVMAGIKLKDLAIMQLSSEAEHLRLRLKMQMREGDAHGQEAS